MRRYAPLVATIALLAVAACTGTPAPTRPPAPDLQVPAFSEPEGSPAPSSGVDQAGTDGNALDASPDLPDRKSVV